MARQWRTIGTAGSNRTYNPRPRFLPKLQSTVPDGVNVAADLSAKLLFQRWPPRHELKAEPIVDHCKPARTQREPLTIDTDDMFAFGRRAVGKSGLLGKLCRCGAQIPVPQRTSRSRAKMTRCPCRRARPSPAKMFDATIHGLANFRTEAVSAQRRFPCARSWRSIHVAPGAVTCASMVRSDRVASDDRLRPLPSS